MLGDPAAGEPSRWAFDVGLHRVKLEHSTQNQPSCRVAGNAGFSVEVTGGATALHGDGWHDMHLHRRVNVSASTHK